MLLSWTKSNNIMQKNDVDQNNSCSSVNISVSGGILSCDAQRYGNSKLCGYECHKNQTEESWYALHTRRHYENIVANILLTKNIKTYLPVLEERRQWAHRTKVLEVPLFPNYVFAHFNEDRKVAILSVKGVINIVGTHSGLSPIPDSQIYTVKTMMESKLKKDIYPFFVEGVPVRVKRGPLNGQEGVLLCKGKIHRFVVCLPVLGQSIGVEVDASSLELI